MFRVVRVFTSLTHSYSWTSYVAVIDADSNSLEMNWVNSKVIPRLYISRHSGAFPRGFPGCVRLFQDRSHVLYCVKKQVCRSKPMRRLAKCLLPPAKYAKTLAQPMQLGSVIEFNHSRQNTGVFEGEYRASKVTQLPNLEDKCNYVTSMN